MLLLNFIVELGLFNGSVGVIVKIVCKNHGGPRKCCAQPACVVVDFPGSCIPAADAWDPNHPTHVPIPLATVWCNKDCCSVTTVLLRVCKAATTFNSQGMTVDATQSWECLVVLLPSPGSQPSRTPGLAQVGFFTSSKFGSPCHPVHCCEPAHRRTTQEDRHWADPPALLVNSSKIA